MYILVVNKSLTVEVPYTGRFWLHNATEQITWQLKWVKQQVEQQRHTATRVYTVATGGGGKIFFTFLKSLTPIYLLTLSLSRSYDEDMRKIAFIPLWRLQSSLRMRSIAWPVYRGPPKPHVTIFWPRIVYSLYNFYGATMTIKGSFYWSISMLKRFSAAKNLRPVIIGPKMTVFRKF